MLRVAHPDLADYLRVLRMTLNNGSETIMRCLRSTSAFGRQVRPERCYNGNKLIRIDGSAELPGVQFVNIADLVQKRDESNTTQYVSLAGVNLVIHTFRLHHEPTNNLEPTKSSPGPESELDHMTLETEQLHAYVTLLPHAKLQCSWES